MPIEITQVKPEPPPVSVPPEPTAPPSSVARKYPNLPNGVQGMNQFMQTLFPNTRMQKQREALMSIKNPVIQMPDYSLHPVPHTHILNGVYSNVVKQLAPSFQWNGNATTPHATVSTNVPAAVDAQANKPGYMKDRLTEIDQNRKNEDLQKPSTMQISIKDAQRLFKSDAPQIPVKIYPNDGNLASENQSATTTWTSMPAWLRRLTGKNGEIKLQDAIPVTEPKTVTSYGPRRESHTILNPSYYIPNTANRELAGAGGATTGFSGADSVFTPWGRLGHAYMHELNHALSNPTALQFYYLTPMARLQEELNRYNKEGVDLFRKNSVLQEESPISDYSLDLKEQVGAQQSFQREHVALKQLLQKDPGKFKQWNADTLNALRALPETINNPDDYQKVTRFYMKNPSMMWEGARYISQLQEKMNRINVLKRWLAENPKSMDRDDWEQQLLLLAEDLAENERRAPFIVNRKVMNSQGQQSVYKRASNNMSNTKNIIPQYATNFADPEFEKILMSENVLWNAVPWAAVGGLLGQLGGDLYADNVLQKPTQTPGNIAGLAGFGLGALAGGLYGRSVGKREIDRYRKALVKAKKAGHENDLIIYGRKVPYEVSFKTGLEKPDANQNKKDTTILTKAASAVYREKLAKNAPMTDAVVGNAKKRKQQNRSMNGFLKQKDKEQSDQTNALNKSAAAEFDPDNLSGSNYDAFRNAWAVIKGLGKGALYGGLAGGGVGLLTDSVLAGKDQRNAKISILTPAGAALGALAGIPIGISSGLKNERMEREKERRSAYQQALMDKLLRGAVDPAAGAAMLAATKE